MSKAENIFTATKFSAIRIIDAVDDLPENWTTVWSYGKTPKSQQFMSQRTLNAVNRLIDKEERRLDMNDRYGVSADDTEWRAKQREAVRVLRDMSAKQQREFDREKEEHKARMTMSYEDFTAKYYPQYC
jgi:hypothetical protein